MMRLSGLTTATDRFLQSIQLGASGNAVSKNTLILLLVLIVECPLVLGMERMDDDLFSLSLEELMSIEVVSKKSERITQAPAIASSYSAEKLHDLGLRTLKDMLDFIPGIEINESLNSGTLVSIRGVPADSNQKVLFLLDGTPYWGAEDGDIPFWGIPIATIERIEVVRGPGSVIYGTNASAGIINVVTKRKGKAYVETHVGAALTNFGGYFDHQTEQGDLFLGFEVQRADTKELKVTGAAAIDPCFCFPTTAFGVIGQRDEFESVLLRWQKDGMSLTAQAHESRTLGDINASIFSPAEYTKSGMLISFNHQIDIKQHKISYFYDWNRFYRKAESEDIVSFFFVDGDGGIRFDDDGSENRRNRMGINSEIYLNSGLSLFGGVEFEKRSINNKVFYTDDPAALFSITQPPINFPYSLRSDGGLNLISENENEELAGFLQLDYRWHTLRSVIGVRHVENDSYGSAYLPRASFVYDWDNASQSLKLLYSEGFNSPTFRQGSATNSLGLPQDIDIKAEKVKTWDLAYVYSAPSAHFGVNLFSTEISDLIVSTSNSDETVMRQGLELDYQYQFNKLKLDSNLTYILQGDSNKEDDQADTVSKILIKVAGSYAWGNHTLGASLRSATKRRNVSSSHMLNTKYQYQPAPNFSYGIELIDVLDDRVKQPNVRNAPDLVAESSLGRTMLIGLKYMF